MFPMTWNFPFRKKNGDVVNIEDAMEGGEPYVLPTATSERLGGVKIGSGVNVSPDGTISASGGGGGSDKIHIFAIPLTSVSASWNEKTFDIPGDYDLSNCVFSVAFGKLGSQARFTSPFIFAMAGRHITIDFFNHDGAGSVSGNLTLTIQEP